MDAQILTQRAIPGLGLRRSAIQAALAATAAALVFLAALFFARRISGGLARPLSAVAMMGLAVVLATIAMGLRWAWRAAGGGKAASRAFCVAWGPAAAVVLLGAALSLPDAPPAGLACFWGLLLAEEIAAAPWRIASYSLSLQERAGVRGSSRTGPPSPYPLPEGKVHEPTPLGSADSARPGDSAQLGNSAQIVQQWTRTRDPATGGETIAGVMRAELAAGERTAVLHAAFCPPFSAAPRLEVHQTEGPPARIKISQLFAHGVRLEVKLDRAATEATDVVVFVEAREPALDRASATLGG